MFSLVYSPWDWVTISHHGSFFLQGQYFLKGFSLSTIGTHLNFNLRSQSKNKWQLAVFLLTFLRFTLQSASIVSKFALALNVFHKGEVVAHSSQEIQFTNTYFFIAVIVF